MVINSHYLKFLMMSVDKLFKTSQDEVWEAQDNDCSGILQRLCVYLFMV